MPADRFIHPKLGHSNKVSSLTDFEYRVWTQYLLSADDFGVMRASAVTLQADNDALHAKPTRTVQRALDHLVVTVGLLYTFEHQGRRYVYQRDWQDFQKVDYPRATIEPKPPSDILADCSEATQRLFMKHPGGQGRRRADGAASDNGSTNGSPNGSLNGSGVVQPTAKELAGAPPRETAKAKANAQAVFFGKGSGENPRSGAGGPMPGYPRLRVFRWMVDQMLASLGDHAGDFDLDGWLQQLEHDGALVVPVNDRERWTWLQSALDYELRQRGWLASAPTTSKRTQQLAASDAEALRILNGSH